MYKYKDMKPQLFTEEGCEKFTKIRDKVLSLLSVSGAVRMEEAIKGALGDSWLMLACVDRLVELGDIREVPLEDVAGQHRIFTR